MAHYISEKMMAIGSARGKAKSSAQKECFEAILTLWDYQSCFPHAIRPFKGFDPIFRAITHIDPNKSSPSYFRNDNDDNSTPKEVEQAINFITNLDAAARIMISYIVRESILHTTDESILEWLNAINGLARSDEARIILKLVPELDDKDSSQDIKAKRKNDLSEHIGRLEAFEVISREIKSELKAELDNLETGD